MFQLCASDLRVIDTDYNFVGNDEPSNTWAVGAVAGRGLRLGLAHVRRQSLTFTGIRDRPFRIFSV
jgi:hypothetical protein